MYKQDDFYKVVKTDEFSLLYDAKEKSYAIWCDELDCRKSIQRVKTSKTFEEVVEIYKKSQFQHFVFIRRNTSSFNPNNKDHLEIGVRCDEGEIGYFIYIEVDTEFENYFIDKYKLEKL